MAIEVSEFNPSVQVLGTDNIADTDEKIRTVMNEVKDYIENESQSAVFQMETKVDEKVDELASVGDTTYTTEAIDNKLNERVALTDIVDSLTSIDTAKPLSANQGKVLKGFIDNINTILASDDTTLDEMQELVNFIKLNKTTLDTLGIANISGLQTALDGKLSLTATATNSSLLEGLASSKFMRAGFADLDDANVLLAGSYRINQGAANSPDSANWLGLVVYGNGSNVVSQLATERNSGNTWARGYNGSTWSAWIKLNNTSLSTTDVLTATAGASTNAVGTYALLITTTDGGSISNGSTYAGSGLRSAALSQYKNTSTYGYAAATNTTTMPGTWRALGTTPAYATLNPVALFLRIS